MSRQADDWDQHWRDYSGVSRWNPAQSYRRKLIAQNLAIGEPRPRILDVGSGVGDLVADLRGTYTGGEYLGIELSETGVDIAQRKVPEANFLRRNLLVDAEVPETFRAWATHAVCSEVLEHVDEPVKLLWNARAFMAPGCRLVVTVPGGPRSAFDRYIGHRRHFNRSDLAELVEQAGLGVETVVGAGFPFFNLYRLAVVARGRRLVADLATSESSGSASRLGDVVMRVFDGLFKLNLDRSRFGYQLVAVCREPG